MLILLFYVYILYMYICDAYIIHTYLYYEIVREAVQRTVENLKHIDLEKYKVGRFISFKPFLCQLFIRLISAYFPRDHIKRPWHVPLNESLKTR